MPSEEDIKVEPEDDGLDAEWLLEVEVWIEGS